jgi:hypothetical protein
LLFSRTIDRKKKSMDKTPLFPSYSKKADTTDFLRNYSCPHYDVCLEEAADRDLYLDCSICRFKNTFVQDLFLNTNFL